MKTLSKLLCFSALATLRRSLLNLEGSFVDLLQFLHLPIISLFQSVDFPVVGHYLPFPMSCQLHQVPLMSTKLSSFLAACPRLKAAMRALLELFGSSPGLLWSPSVNCQMTCLQELLGAVENSAFDDVIANVLRWEL